MSVLDQDTATDYGTRSAETLAAVQAGGPDKGALKAAATAWAAAGVSSFAP